VLLYSLLALAARLRSGSEIEGGAFCSLE